MNAINDKDVPDNLSPEKLADNLDLLGCDLSCVVDLIEVGEQIVGEMTIGSEDKIMARDRGRACSILLAGIEGLKKAHARLYEIRRPLWESEQAKSPSAHDARA